ncbi:SUMO1 sentrin specific peptidase 1 [Cichlidogyrus casuarinus]|uniref:SUMO1 sentrin specific peptidase 1 n=1 Tax=Cichlidogyrus casuarinus TaxID=1844966 RepID=A0ABD2PQT6_9PLAT
MALLKEEDDCKITAVELGKETSEKYEFYQESLKNCKYISDEWISDLQQSKWQSNQQKKSIAVIENSITFWESQRRKARDAEMLRLEETLAALETKGPVLIDPYLEPRPVIEGLPYKRSVFKPPVKLPILTELQWLSVEKQLSGRPLEEVILDRFRLAVTVKDMLSLFPNQWLTDMIINLYLQMIHHRSIIDNELKPSAVMSTFFYTRLSSGGYSVVKRWTKKLDIFAHNFLFFPIHDRGIHWCLAVADFQEKVLTYYDSMGGKNDVCLNRLFDYLKSEHATKKGVPLADADQWQLVNGERETPQQKNGSDCGVFACQTAEFLSRGSELVFQQEDMPCIRQRMMFEILNQKLLTTETDLSHLKD